MAQQERRERERRQRERAGRTGMRDHSMEVEVSRLRSDLLTIDDRRHDAIDYANDLRRLLSEEGIPIPPAPWENHPVAALPHGRGHDEDRGLHSDRGRNKGPLASC